MATQPDPHAHAIVPIGVDCGLANLLRNSGLRTVALPFDWTVTYHGVAQMFKNDFKDLVPQIPGRGLLNTKYGIKFHHDIFPHDAEKYERRLQRLRNLLVSDTPLVFFRKGHASHLHDEYSVVDDLQDAEELDAHLQARGFGGKKYKIIVVLVCGLCFDCDKTYSSSTPRIEVQNIATPKCDDVKFNSLALRLLSPYKTSL